MLSNNFSSVELDEHGSICLEVLDRNGEAEVVQKKELELQVVELCQRKAADLL